MAKTKTNATVKSFHINIHSDRPPQIIHAICKGGNVNDALNVARKLYESTDAPYVVYIKDAAGETLFHKKL